MNHNSTVVNLRDLLEDFPPHVILTRPGLMQAMLDILVSILFILNPHYYAPTAPPFQLHKDVSLFSSVFVPRRQKELRRITMCPLDFLVLVECLSQLLFLIFC